MVLESPRQPVNVITPRGRRSCLAPTRVSVGGGPAAVTMIWVLESPRQLVHVIMPRGRCSWLAPAPVSVGGGPAVIILAMIILESPRHPASVIMPGGRRSFLALTPLSVGIGPAAVVLESPRNPASVIMPKGYRAGGPTARVMVGSGPAARPEHPNPPRKRRMENPFFSPREMRGFDPLKPPPPRWEITPGPKILKPHSLSSPSMRSCPKIQRKGGST